MGAPPFETGVVHCRVTWLLLPLATVIFGALGTLAGVADAILLASLLPILLTAKTRKS